MKVEVAIIGAGPGGSTLAAFLARRGIGVVLIDRDRFPRDKLCGEFLSYDALPILDHLGLLPRLDEFDAPAISRCRVVGRRDIYEFEFPRPARGVSRMLLDDLLFRCAVTNGALDFSGWTAIALDPNRVEIERNGERTTIDARVVVGAWGRWGRFDVQLGRRFVRDRAHRNFGFKRHYREAEATSDTIDLYSFRGGYLGVSPVEGGITNICGLVQAGRLRGLKGRWDSFVTTIREEEPHLDRMYAAHKAAQDDFLSSDPVIFRSRSAVERGIVMVGDASGVVDPLTGNGMAMAIQSALLAAPAIRSLLTAADRTAAEDGYRSAHHRMFTSRIRWSRQVAKLLSNPRLLDVALRLGRGAGPGRFLLARTRADAAAVERTASAEFW